MCSLLEQSWQSGSAFGLGLVYMKRASPVNRGVYLRRTIRGDRADLVLKCEFRRALLDQLLFLSIRSISDRLQALYSIWIQLIMLSLI